MKLDDFISLLAFFFAGAITKNDGPYSLVNHNMQSLALLLE